MVWNCLGHRSPLSDTKLEDSLGSSGEKVCETILDPLPANQGFQADFVSVQLPQIALNRTAFVLERQVYFTFNLGSQPFKHPLTGIEFW